ncbi:MAG TPA: GH116 family glycosyl-hydrolase, partial [Lacipirellulaceae bacterium]|nr:GH116 family glycosyl-hydrolase [Lacipirellulaceae bacterium]
LLATNAQGKRPRPVENVTGVFPPTDYTPAYFDVGLEGLRFARAIDYFGHYPILDMEFDLDGPISAGMRAWSPMLPGDDVASMAPAIEFEFSLRNRSDVEQQVTLAVNFPGFGQKFLDAEVTIQDESIDDAEGLTGVVVMTSARDTPDEMSYVLASVEGAGVRRGGPLGVDAQRWQDIEKRLPARQSQESGASLAVDVRLKPGQSVRRRIVLAWHAPVWNAGGMPHEPNHRSFKHMYARHYRSALESARFLVQNRDDLVSRIIAWHEEIYGDESIPGWLADCLINNLHLITETSVWGQAEGDISQFSPELGLFALNECPRGCPQLECIPCSFYGNMPLVYFYPRAALSTLHGYKEYQFPDGRPPWIFGGMTAHEEKNRGTYDLAAPDKGYQSVLNASCSIATGD